MSSIEPVIVVITEVLTSLVVAVSRVFKEEAVIVESLKMIASFPNPVMPVDA